MAKHKSVREWLRRHEGKHECMCGCGEIIEILSIHHSRGIPKFIKGHNFGSEYNPQIEDPLVPEERKTRWEMLSDEEQDRRLGNLKKYEKGDKHPKWKGGRVEDENGYVRILMPEHPFAQDGYVLEHRVVMEEYLAKMYPNNCPYLIKIKGKLYLKPEVVVHHVDQNKSNNSMGEDGSKPNLFPFPNTAAHVFWHKSKLPEEEKIKLILEGKYLMDKEK